MTISHQSLTKRLKISWTWKGRQRFSLKVDWWTDVHQVFEPAVHASLISHARIYLSFSAHVLVQQLSPQTRRDKLSELVGDTPPKLTFFAKQWATQGRNGGLSPMVSQVWRTQRAIPPLPASASSGEYTASRRSVCDTFFGEDVHGEKVLQEKEVTTFVCAKMAKYDHSLKRAKIPRSWSAKLIVLSTG